MAVSVRREAQKKAIREAILVASRNIVTNEGWQAVSIRKIADAIGYSLPVVYDYFKSKDAILEEFVKNGFAMLTEEITFAKDKLTEPTAQLEAIGDAYFNFAFKHSEYYQMMFGLGMPTCEMVREVEEIGNFSGTVISTMQKMMTPPVIKEQTILKFHTFWSILHGLTSINMVNVAATPNRLQQQVLQDAIQGFIKNINN